MGSENISETQINNYRLCQPGIFISSDIFHAVK